MLNQIDGDQIMKSPNPLAISVFTVLILLNIPSAYALNFTVNEDFIRLTVNGPDLASPGSTIQYRVDGKILTTVDTRVHVRIIALIGATYQTIFEGDALPAGSYSAGFTFTKTFSVSIPNTVANNWYLFLGINTFTGSQFTRSWGDFAITLVQSPSYSALQSEVSSLRQQVNSLQSQISSLQSTIQSLNNQIANLQAERTSLLAERDRLQREVSSLREQAGTLLSQLSSLQSRIDSLNSEITSLQSRSDKLVADLTSTRRSLADAQARLASKESQLQETQSALTSTQGQLASTEGLLRTFSAIYLPIGIAVPSVIGAVLAVLLLRRKK